MDTRDYISISGICVTATVALLIAHLQRKQMRQIEAYRVDRTVGLIPPPSPVWLFIKRYYLLISAAANVGLLMWEATSSGPITRVTVVAIVIFAGKAVYDALLYYVSKLESAVIGILGMQREFLQIFRDHKHAEVNPGDPDVLKPTKAISTSE